MLLLRLALFITAWEVTCTLTDQKLAVWPVCCRLLTWPDSRLSRDVLQLASVSIDRRRSDGGSIRRTTRRSRSYRRSSPTEFDINMYIKHRWWSARHEPDRQTSTAEICHHLRSDRYPRILATDLVSQRRRTATTDPWLRLLPLAARQTTTANSQRQHPVHIYRSALLSWLESRDRYLIYCKTSIE